MSNTFRSYKLNVYGFEKYLVNALSAYDGIRYIYRFPNGYGAVVSKHTGTKGCEDNLWELSVVKWNDDLADGWRVVGDTEITNGNDTIGNLAHNNVRELLKQISELPDSQY